MYGWNSNLVKVTLAVILIVGLVAVAGSTYARQDVTTSAPKALDRANTNINQFDRGLFDRAPIREEAYPEPEEPALLPPVLGAQTHAAPVDDFCNVLIFWEANDLLADIVIERRNLQRDEVWTVVERLPASAPFYNELVPVAEGTVQYRAKLVLGMEESEYSVAIGVDVTH